MIDTTISDQYPMLQMQPDRSSRSHLRGFTLIEVMVVVSILAILIALAAPSFTPMIERWRVRQVTEQLQSTLYYGRSEAIKRSGGVVVQRLLDTANGCTSTSPKDEWDCGWFVCADTNSDGTCQDTEPMLQRYDAPANIHVTRSVSDASITLNRWGLVSGAWLGFTIMPRGKTVSDPAASGVCMSLGGRIRIIPQEAIPCTP